ncbi:NAD(P)-dependent oxidoreductase [Sporosarcina sp. JAI121]|uniref:NAD(P)-dependent oxidoreductase n=1 Tax=Sporosarcina sp. JAI121 TaxID=2723064 RepID=UPI0015CCB52D|nr:NAD(P)-dependent oxidoreductase [Sporosarcina sp. JAI121]NYF24280.1 dipicolinate synthase subunit A [Sporosarcina sp. JAI121]
MTEANWLFIGTDSRLGACSEIMSKNGFTSHHIGTDQYSKQLGDLITELTPGHIVFPILQMKGALPPELLKEGTALYTGIASEEWLKPLKDSGLKIHSYLKEEQYIWQNAKLTAEGFIHEYYNRTGRIISGNRFCVAGFGRVGKATAHALASLGGHVTVLARSDDQLAEASYHGYKIERLTDEWDMKEGILINTIPAQWLAISENPDLHIYDLASAPGCLKGQLSPEYYTVLLGLPGKVFPVDAAAALADSLGRIYRG